RAASCILKKGPNRSNTVWNICRKNRGRIKRKKKRKKGSSSDGLTFSLAGRKSALNLILTFFRRIQRESGKFSGNRYFSNDKNSKSALRPDSNAFVDEFSDNQTFSSFPSIFLTA